MKASLIVPAVFLCVAISNTCSAAELDSADFDFKYDGADIFDGADFQNDWSVAGDVNAGDLLDGASIELNERGNIVLKQTPDNRNFWIQQDTEDSPWEDGVDGGSISFTFEIRAHLIGTEPDGDPVNNGFTMWAADGFQRGIAVVQEDSIQSFGRPGEILDERVNDDGFHTFRMTYDADEDLYFMFRDGELVGDDGFFAQAATGNNRLIVGDCCTNANDLAPFIFEELEIEYVRYDLDGAYDPVQSVMVPGDFNNNGSRDVNDLDLLTAAMISGDAAFDLDEDGDVDFEDRKVWVEQLSNTFIGDSNFDGEFNSADFVAVFTKAKYETGQAATWSEGDWNGDGLFGSSDFVAAFASGGYEGGARNGGLMVVPEPSSLVLMVAGVLVLVRRR
ncbi:MAG: PEP-CTERM sorting domain-containing protein [Planctomycetales bacterium]|nr:PEP-CTERM sorting domain-containing protein [Planctomycetales bacterium]